MKQKEQQLEQAQAEIAELKRQLFGPKTDRLTPEQEMQLAEVTRDLAEELERPVAVSTEVLEAGGISYNRSTQFLQGATLLTPDAILNPGAVVTAVGVLKAG